MQISFESYLELEKIGHKAFSPLNGFMGEEEYNSVVKTMRLPTGKIFPIPILLPLNKNLKEKNILDKNIPLYFNKKKVGIIYVKNIFRPNFQANIHSLFGTNDTKHPGYQMLRSQGKLFIGGPIKLFKNSENIYNSIDLTPLQVKERKNILNLKSLSGFQTRNVPHKAHEYIINHALNYTDGVLIHPLIGKKKIGDFTPSAVVESYKLLIRNFLPKNKFILSALTTSMRYAGPREALFHALIRKNYGCTHFIVGRDHAGVSNYYEEYEAQDLCVKFEKELDINIIRMRGPFFCKVCNLITTDLHCNHLNQRIPISGTKIRNDIKNNMPINSNFMRHEIIERIKLNKIFIDEE